MFNCLYNTPISYCNPAVLPVAYNYINGSAKGFNTSFYGGYQGSFSGSVQSVFIPQTYNFGGSNTGLCLSSGISVPAKSYNFSGNVSVPTVGKNTYNFTGGRTLIFSCSGSSDNKTQTTSKNKNNLFSTTQTYKPSETRSIQTTQSAKIKTNSPKSHFVQNKPSRVDLRSDFVKVAYKYNGVSESDGSHKKFCINIGCNQFNEGEWCTDFVTYVVKESYKNNGKRVPAGFGDHDVETLKNWAIRYNYFTRTSNKSNSPSYIAQNIKPGDIMILNENNASHTGFVTKVDSDGTFHTIEGNRGDKVTTATYRPESAEYRLYLSGFIQLA